MPGVSSPGTPSTLATNVAEIPVAVTINEVLVRDTRFPTSVTLDDSDAHSFPDGAAWSGGAGADAGHPLSGVGA